MHTIYDKKEKENRNKPGGAEPHDSQRSGDLTPAVNISFDDTILTLSGFTVQTRKTREKSNKLFMSVWLAGLFKSL